MRVVITGGAGFIGSNLVHYWVVHHPDDEVLVYDALTYAGRRESLTDLEGRRGFHFVHGDIGDSQALSSVLHDVDLVVHLAAESHNDRAIRDPVIFVRTNVLGTAMLLEACRKAGVKRLHHVSSDEVFGTLSLDEPRRFTADSPYQPRGPYAASKAGSDHLVRAWSETYGFPVTISNCGNNFGPFQFPEKLIALSLVRLIRGQKVQLYGDGLHVRDWIYVEDHCEAVDLVAHLGRPGSSYLVSAENEFSNREIIDRLLRMFGRGQESVEFVPDRLGHDRRYALDPSKLKTELGWKPRHTLDEALYQTAEWYRQNPEWWRPLMGPTG